MKRFSVLLILLPIAFAYTQAQDFVYRPESTFFVKPKVGLSNYWGDNERSPLNFNGDALSIGTPISLGAEVGYQLSVPFSVSFALVYGDYPVITQFPPPSTRDDDIVADDPSTRISVQVFGRTTFGEKEQRAALYVNYGLVASFGTARQNTPPNFNVDEVDESAAAFGPLVGVGVDYALNARSSFFAELNTGLHFPDDAIDANADNGGGIDMLSGITLGLKINFKAAITPIGIASLECPTGLIVMGSEVDFSAEYNPAATLPIEQQSWSFGDGVTADGAAVTHTFTSDGTYTVTHTAANAAGPAEASCEVTVIESPSVLAVTASRSTVSICDDDPSVSFSANVRGTEPLTYAWDFGDGSTSGDAAPAHTFEEMGTYTVTLQVTNQVGSDTQTTTVVVNDEGCFDCNISTMNSVFFDRNSSVLNEEALPLLAENLEILQNCEFNVRVEGHSSSDERQSQQLSEDRARAVAQYYTDNGIDAARLAVEGMGSSAQTGKKSGAAQFRRVDTIPEL